LIGKTWKMAAVIALVATISLALAFVSSTPTSAMNPRSEHYEAQLPSDYGQSKQTFLMMFPEFEANGLHYKNPNIGGSGVLTLDAAYVKAKSDLVADTLHLTARNLKLELSVPVYGSILLVSGSYAEMDIHLNPADPGEVCGTITATFRGNVKFHTPPPLFPSPIPYFSYQGPELTVEMTLIQQ